MNVHGIEFYPPARPVEKFGKPVEPVMLACRHMSITGPVRSATCFEGCVLTPTLPSTVANGCILTPVADGCIPTLVG